MKYVGLFLIKVVEFPSVPLVLGMLSLGAGAMIPKASQTETARRVGRVLVWGGAILTVLAFLGFGASVFIKVEYPRR